MKQLLLLLLLMPVFRSYAQVTYNPVIRKKYDAAWNSLPQPYREAAAEKPGTGGKSNGNTSPGGIAFFTAYQWDTLNKKEYRRMAEAVKELSMPFDSRQLILSNNVFAKGEKICGRIQVSSPPVYLASESFQKGYVATRLKAELYVEFTASPAPASLPHSSFPYSMADQK